MRLSGSAALALLLVSPWVAACSTPLGAFVCSDSFECTDGAVSGVCTELNYCAFPDAVCGLRYGEASGELSGSCVGSDSDAGVGSDAGAGSAPVASFTVTDPECDHTVVTLDASDSRGSGGRTITEFAWTIRDPDGGFVDSVRGQPGAAGGVSPIYLSGSLVVPTVTFAPYLSNQALHLRSNTEDTVVVQPFQYDPGLTDSLRFFMAAAVSGPQAVSEALRVGIYSVPPAGGQPLVNQSFEIQEDDGVTLLEAEFELGDAPEELFIVISVALNVEVWIDNVGLGYDEATGATSSLLTRNRDFEVGASEWSTNEGGLIVTELLSNELARYGRYTIELVITDSNGAQSAPETVAVDHQPCGVTGGGL